MDSLLDNMNIEDPYAGADSDEEMADVAPRTIQKREKKKEKKERKEKKLSEVADDGTEPKKRKHKPGEVEVDGKRKKKKSKTE